MRRERPLRVWFRNGFVGGAARGDVRRKWELLEAARPFLPHFRFLLDDLSALSAAALASRPLAALPRLVQLALWASRSFPRLQDAAPFMRALLATLVRDERTRALLGQFYLYVWSTAPADIDEDTIRSILV